LKPGTVALGDYLGQIQRWLEVFDGSQLFIGFTEQLRSSPRAFLNAIFDFLGVERLAQFDDALLHEQVNVGETRSLTPELRDVLRRIYAGRTRQLVDFIQREFAIDPPVEWNDLLAASEVDTSGPPAADDNNSPDNLCYRLAPSVDDEQLEEWQRAERLHPHLVASYLEWNIVEFRGQFYGVPCRFGSVDFFDRDQLARPEIIVMETADGVRAQINQIMMNDMSAPELVLEDFGGFNIVHFRGRHIGLAKSLGPVDLFQIDDAWLTAGREAGKVAVVATLAQAKEQITQLIGANPCEPMRRDP
jgi:hypothetical protein